ncbi:tetratricopeptide repeat protein [Actinocrispum sp. NPDC049592]|uniref:AfsR/SARP family transcriptional regulator n=1 Tax=Actinocrispum sp. NPDC049592 TaxID=3154835 RepID=UPI00343B24DC
MRFSLLGPIRAWLGDEELETGPPTQRALLAFLLVHAGQPVALSEIVDALWPDDPPRTAVNIIHRHIGMLRRLIEPDLPARASGSVLLRSSGGYRLNAGPDELDLLRFRDLHSAARAATGADAAALYAEAIGLWHGHVAADLPDNVRAHAAFAEVEREYLAALQEAAVLSPARMLSRLQQASAGHPLDEVLHARLIEALAASGYETEALQAYEAVRERLADELGIDPGAELRAAHSRVVHPQAASRNGRPTQLPADLAGFAGRATELAHAARVNTSAMTTVAIFGMAGVGKTTMAVRLAHEVAPEFPDGQLYVHLRGFDPGGQVTSSAAIRGFLEALGVPPNRMPGDLEAQAALYRSLLAGKRMLVVLDDARDTEHVRQLLPGTPGCMAIITSRSQLRGLVVRTGAMPVALDVLSSNEARDLLSQRLGAGRVAAEPVAVEEIIDHCGRLPLALAVVAARAATYPDVPLASIAAELHGSASLDALGDWEIDVRTVFSWSYHALNTQAARLFRLLGVHPGPDISVAAAASLAGLSLHQTMSLLDDLTHAHLVNELISGRYMFHDLLRTYAAELVDSAEAGPARERLLDHYLHSTVAATTLLFPFRERVPLSVPHAGAIITDLVDHNHAAEWLTEELAVLQVLPVMAAEAGFDGHAWRIPLTIERFLDRQGRWQEQVALQRAGLSSAERANDRYGVAQEHRALGFGLGRWRRYEEGVRHLTRAADLFAAEEDFDSQAHTYRNLAFLSNMQEHHDQALEHYRRARELYEITGNQNGQALLYNEVGWTYILQGDYEKALPECLLAIDLHRAIGNPNGEASAADSVGYALHHLDRNLEAIPYLEQALRIYQDIADRPTEADTLSHIGDARLALGDIEAARTAWQQALAILEEVGHSDAEEVRGKLQTLDTRAPA